jgi:hypothetical protein
MRLAVAVSSSSAKAVATIDRLVTTGLEGYLGLGATLGTDYRVHLPGTLVVVTPLLGSTSLPTGGTALRLVGIALRGEELLFTHGKGEGRTTLGTGKCLLRQHKRMTSFTI